jgi:hypothetical protein
VAIPVAGGENTFDAAKKIWPLWILLIGIAGTGVILWRARLKQFTSVPGTSRPSSDFRHVVLFVLEQHAASTIPCRL